jgi:hypothetical protein
MCFGLPLATHGCTAQGRRHTDLALIRGARVRPDCYFLVQCFCVDKVLRLFPEQGCVPYQGKFSVTQIHGLTPLSSTLQQKHRVVYSGA